MSEPVLCAGRFYCRSCGKHLRLHHVPGVLNLFKGPSGFLPRCCSCGGEVLPIDDDARKLRETMNDNAIENEELFQEVFREQERA